MFMNKSDNMMLCQFMGIKLKVLISNIKKTNGILKKKKKKKLFSVDE